MAWKYQRIEKCSRKTYHSWGINMMKQVSLKMTLLSKNVISLPLKNARKVLREIISYHN